MINFLFYRLELEGIKVKGQGCPKPVKTWAQCGVSKRVLDILKKYNYEKPTPIQMQVSSISNICTFIKKKLFLVNIVLQGAKKLQFLSGCNF